jgi:hypothetical protein
LMCSFLLYVLFGPSHHCQKRQRGKTRTNKELKKSLEPWTIETSFRVSQRLA